MAIAKTAVVLMLESGAAAPQSPDWYRNYFLGPSGGAGGFWYKQSNGGLSFEGDVFGWLTFSQSPDWSDRESVIARTLDVANPIAWASLGTNVPDIGNVAILAMYDICIIFIARVANQGTPVGQVPRLSLSQRLASFVILDTNSPFDICAHEMGHALHLGHSFDDTDNQYEPWQTSGGEYGHPCCVMAAGTYGGAASKPVWTPNLPAPHPTAMDRVPPSLNAWYASLGGWIERTDWTVGDSDRTIEIESLGSWPGHLAKVIRIKGANGNEYSIEYRSRSDYFDSGLAASAIVVNHGTGGRAYRAQGGGATFLGAVNLPLPFNRTASVFNHKDERFSVEVLDWKGTSVVVRLANGQAVPQRVELTLDMQELSTRREDLGPFDYTGAGVHCVRGVWPVTRVLKSQGARLTLNLPTWPQPFATRWWIDETELVGPSGSVKIETEVDQVLPLPNGSTSTRKIDIGFVMKGPNEVVLTNVAVQGGYSVTVRCSVPFSVGEFVASVAVDFSGEELEFPREFNNALIACLIDERDRSRPQKRRHIVLPPHDLPRPVPDEPRYAELLSTFEETDAAPLANVVQRQLFGRVTGYPARRVRLVPITQGSLSDLTSRPGFVVMRSHEHAADEATRRIDSDREHH